MKQTFDIELAEKLKINKLGKPILVFGGFLFLLFWLCVLPAKYLPFEIKFIYLVEVLNRNVYYLLASTIVVVVLGDWLYGIRKYEKAQLELQPDRIILLSKTKRLELKYKNIKKFYGAINFLYSYKRPTFKILTLDNEKYEIRAHRDIFIGLTDTFPDKT